MVEEEIARERNLIGHNGNPLHGGTIVYNTIQVLCTFPQITINASLDQDISTTCIHAISRLQELGEF